MSRLAFVMVLVFLLAAALWLALTGSSRTSFFPRPKEIAVDPQNPSEALIPFLCRIDGLERIGLSLTEELKRRPIRIVLCSDQGKPIADLEADENTRRRARRIFNLRKPIEDCADRKIVMHLVFEDGPVLKDGLNRSKVFRGLGVTLIYHIKGSEVWRNYSLFKPFPAAVLSTALVVFLYALSAAFLWWSVIRNPADPPDDAMDEKSP